MRHIIIDFKPMSGLRCVSNSIKQIFHYFGRPLSEEMIFGLAAGLNFLYFETKRMSYPIIGGRTKIGNFEESLSCNLGITIETHKTSSTNKAYSELQKLIEKDIPVTIYVDMNSLSYLGLPNDVHFGGHTVVVFGIDEEEGSAYVSDRDSEVKKVTLNPDEKPSDFHRVPLDEIARARGLKHKPYPPENKWLTFDLSGMWEIDRNIIFEAIREMCTIMRCSPIRNLGVKGIHYFSQRVRDWKELDKQKLNRAAFNAYIMIDEIGGTGGGAFRRIYGNFLKESASLIGEEGLESIGKEYITLSEWWDDTAQMFYDICKEENCELLKDISESFIDIYRKENKLIQQLCMLINE